MNRRSFFARWVTRPASGSGNPSPVARPLSAGLEPYVPNEASPWNPIRMGHLLRRTTFLPQWSDIELIRLLPPSLAVDLLLTTPSMPAAPPVAEHITESLEGLDVTLQNQLRAVWRGDQQKLSSWWIGAMLGAGSSIVEKMVAFWSGHFTTEFETDDGIVVAPLLYRQNQLFREMALGNFKDLVMAVTLDGAMLVYLGGDLNNAGAPNENYARELLELYTTGLGHYTEGDVQNAARILTGWRAARYEDKPSPNGMFNTYFLPNFHDVSAKEFLGVSFPARDNSTNTEFLVRRDEVRRLVDTIFEKRGRAVAEFISRKLYRFFVYSNPGSNDEGIISAMADLFIQNDFEIRPLMAALLKSRHFFDNANLGAQIKTPAEFSVGLVRQMGGNRDVVADMPRLSQELFDPPNVSGWPGYHDWITTTSYPIRSEIAADVVQSASDDKVVAFIRSFAGHTEVADLVANVAAVLLPRQLSPQRKAALQAKLLAGAPDYEWGEILANSPSTAARNMRDMLTMVVELPDFQLC